VIDAVTAYAATAVPSMIATVSTGSRNLFMMSPPLRSMPVIPQCAERG
jgi:hypothetical protein